MTESLIHRANNFCKEEFGFSIEKSILNHYTSSQWNDFCSINTFEKDSEGLYVPKSYKAYIKDSPRIISNSFHELFGHGLFCEHSILGQELVNADKNNNGLNFLKSENNSIYGLDKIKFNDYEGFAMLMESILCKEVSSESEWTKKKSLMYKSNIDLFEYYSYAEKKLTRFGLMSQMGFPKYNYEKNLIPILKNLYSKKYSNIELIMLYGSKKPYSDIDLFIVSSNESKNYFNGWLDIYELNKEEFNQMVINLDISVTDPLFSGELIYGNEYLLENMREKILNMPITNSAIDYNLLQCKKQTEYLPTFSETDKRKKDCLSYIDSYSKNAGELIQNNKRLTLANLNKIKSF